MKFHMCFQAKAQGALMFTLVQFNRL